MKKLYAAVAAAALSTTVTAQTTLPLPFHDDFDHHDNVGLIDSNNDNIGFGLLYNPTSGAFESFRYDDREAWKSADDWMVFPYFEFEQGLTYKITVNMSMSGAGAALFDCFLGKGNDDMDDTEVNSWTKVTPETWTIANDAVDTWQEHSVEFTSPVTGAYRFALHFTSPVNRQTYTMDWITIGQGLTTGSPAQPVCGMPTYKGVDGKLQVTFKITPADKDTDGNALPAELTAKIVRTAEGKPAKEFAIESLAPSTAAEFTDPDGLGIPAEYAVYVYSGTAPGVKAVVKSKPTISKGKAPANVTIARKEGNRFTARWDAVTAGESSFYPFLPASVTYTATDHAGKALELTMTGATSAEFDYPEVTEGQVAAFINVYAVNEAGQGKGGKSNSIVIGQPIAGEFHEDFAGKKYNAQVWNPDPATGAWSVTSTSIKGTDGQPGILAYGQAAAKTAELTSPILDLSGMVRPFVTMYVYIKPASTYNNAILPVIRAYGETEDYPLCAESFTDHKLTDGSELPEANGWHKYTWQIKDVPAAKLGKCNLVLKGTGDSSWNYIYMDDISVKDYPADADLALLSVEMPDKATVGKPAQITATVANKGFNAFGPFSVRMLKDGAEVATASCDGIEAEASAPVALSYTPLPEEADKTVAFTLEIVAEGDEKADNNSATASLKVALNLLPTVRDLTLSVSEGADVLSWLAPEPGESGMAETEESFEKWPEGPLNGTVNGWTFVDVDGNLTWGYDSSDPSYKKKIGAEIHHLGGIDGSFGLLVPKCNNEATGGVYGTPEKWIIMPELIAGSKVQLERYVKGCYGNSSKAVVEYCWSAAGNSPEDFTNIFETETVNSKTLAEAAVKTFTLPADAKFFAIHVTDCQASFIAFDNFNYVAPVGVPVLQGYNVYCNSELMASLDAEASTYTVDLTPESEQAKAPSTDEIRYYYVSAVYDQGESAAGTVVDSKTAGIAAAETAGSSFSMTGRILTAGNAALTVTDAAGRILARVAAGASTELPAAGIYIVSAQGMAAKVAVR